MKKFFTFASLQPGNFSAFVYDAVDNGRLAMNQPTHYPILTAVNGYCEANDTIRVFVMVEDNDICRTNTQFLREELAEICQRKGINCPNGLEEITVLTNDCVAEQINTFQRLIDLIEDGDEIFMCMTYGTKPKSLTLTTAVKYAYRIYNNTSISCVVYGGIDRSREPNVMSVYDMTAMIQLDEMINVMAANRVKNPRELIMGILSQE